MNLIETAETVLHGNLMHLAGQPSQVRTLLARFIKSDEAEGKQLLAQVEQAIDNDIAHAKSQMPSFLKDSTISTGFSANVRRKYLDAIMHAVNTEAQMITHNLQGLFQVELPQWMRGDVTPPAPPTPPMPTPEPGDAHVQQ